MRLVIYGRILSVGPTRPCGANTAFAFPTPVQANTACLRTGAYCPSAPSGRAGPIRPSQVIRRRPIRLVIIRAHTVRRPHVAMRGQYGFRISYAGAGQYGLLSHGRILPVGPKWPCGANTALAGAPAQANTACHYTGAYCPSAPRGHAGPIRLSQLCGPSRPKRMAAPGPNRLTTPVQANTACCRTGAYCPSAPSGRTGPIRPSQVRGPTRPQRSAALVQANTACHFTGAYCPSALSGHARPIRPAPQRGRSLRVVASPSRQRQAQRRLSLVRCARNATLRDGRRRAGDPSRFS